MSRQSKATEGGKRETRQTHWYHPAIPAKLPEPEPEPEVGRARMRIQRRREDGRLPRVDWTWLVIGMALFGVVGLIALIAISGGGPVRGEAVAAASGPTSAPDAGNGASASPQPVALQMPEIKPWNADRRLTILIMGLDKRPGEAGTGFRTDTLILLSLDPVTGSVGMLSIPRDIMVPIPGQPEMQPINSAYVLGELERPKFGPRLTADTIQYNFGMRVDHYVVLSFEAVISFVDAIGGITVDVPSEIIDNEYPDWYYGIETLRIPAGTIQMNGDLALKYARTRHQTSDFDRARRQQQVIMAIRQKVLRPDILPQLVSQAPLIWDTVSRGVITDMTFDQMLSLGWYAKDIGDLNINRGTLDDRYIRATQLRGQTVLTINRATIVELLTTIFGPDYNR